MDKNYYYYGTKIRCKGTFSDADGDEQDPENVYFQFIEPEQDAVSYEYGVDPEVVKEATGIYYVDLDGSTIGDWKYRFYSTGVGQAASEATFTVRSSAFD